MEERSLRRGAETGLNIGSQMSSRLQCRRHCVIWKLFCRQCRCTSCHPFRHPILAGIGSGKRRTGRAWSCMMEQAHREFAYMDWDEMEAFAAKGLLKPSSSLFSEVFLSFAKGMNGHSLTFMKQNTSFKIAMRILFINLSPVRFHLLYLPPDHFTDPDVRQ